MLAPTHIVFGSSLSLIILAVFGLSNSLHWTVLLCAITGSLLPDIDLPKSTVGRLFPWLSKHIEKKYGHRTITHSLIAWIISTLCFAMLVGIGTLLWNILLPHLDSATLGTRSRWTAAFSIGYLSHLILDMLNPSGVPLFWPNPGRDVVPGNPKFRPATGSKAEAGIFVALCIMLLLSLPLSQYGMSASLRWLLATPDSAIQYLQSMNTHSYLDFEGLFSHSKIAVKGRAEILDSADKMLVIYFNGKVYTLGRSTTADIMATHARVHKTEQPIEVQARQFTDKPKRDLLRQVPESHLLSGTIQLPKNLTLQLPESEHGMLTMRQNGRVLTLYFAQKEDIDALSLTKQYHLQKQKNMAKLRTLKREKKEAQTLFNTLDESDGLTEEGRALLQSQSDYVDQKMKRDKLLLKMENLALAIKTQEMILKEQEALYSGTVLLRPTMPPPEVQDHFSGLKKIDHILTGAKAWSLTHLSTDQDPRKDQEKTNKGAQK